MGTGKRLGKVLDMPHIYFRLNGFKAANVPVRGWETQVDAGKTWTYFSYVTNLVTHDGSYNIDIVRGITHWGWDVSVGRPIGAQ